MSNGTFQGNSGDYRKLNFNVPGAELTLAQQIQQRKEQEKLAKKAEKRAARKKVMQSLFTWNFSLPKMDLDKAVHKFIIGKNPVETDTAFVAETAHENPSLQEEKEAAPEVAKKKINKDMVVGFAAVGVCVLCIAAIYSMCSKKDKKVILPAKQIPLKQKSDKHHNDTVFMLAQKDLFDTKHKYDTLYSKQVNMLDKEFQDKDSSYSLSRDFASDSMHIVFKEDSVRLGNTHPGLIFSLNDQGQFLVQGKIKDSLYPMHNSKLQYLELKK